MGLRSRIGTIGILVTALLWGSAWLAPAAAEEKWGPFRGRIVDTETGQPIQGAVVLMIWYKLVYAVVQTNMEFYDAREAVSGPDGTFEIPRLSPPFFTFRIDRPHWTLFAPGYEVQRVVVTPPTGQRLVDPTVIEMRPLKTREERLKALTIAVLPSVPDDKKPLYTQALIRERKNLGLDP